MSCRQGVIQIPRGENEQADCLAKAASVEYMTTPNKVLSFIQPSPLIDVIDVQEIGSESNWTTTLASYLRNGTLPKGKEAARKLKVQASRFVLIRNVLYKRGWILLADHAEGRSGVCQNLRQVPKVQQHYQATNGRANSDNRPMVIRPMGTGHHWLIPNSSEAAKVPNRIKNHYSSPAHPQANGQVEVTNQSLLRRIKTRLEGTKGVWPKELPSVLWAYRTTVRTPTGENSFRLTYESEAVIPVEIGLMSYRVDNHNEGRNDEAIRLQLDLVDEVRATAEQRLARYQDLMEKHYNSRVKHRDFKVGDLVLKVMGAARDPMQGKLDLNWEGPYRITSWLKKGIYHLETLDGQKLHHPWNATHLRKYYQ
ncbi:uncharacterized protein LOC142635644 [Castanea sativa]|uniref:uncharacterized protein LOC142635644 n=1 Tax=Castanea sativa TaxID=21020 RepID=UPI003F64EEFF